MPEPAEYSFDLIPARKDEALRVHFFFYFFHLTVGFLKNLVSTSTINMNQLKEGKTDSASSLKDAVIADIWLIKLINGIGTNLNSRKKM